MGFHTETVVGSIREASDFLGLPIEVDGEVRYSPPAFARRAVGADRALINFDELTTSAPSVSKAMLRIFQEREVGELPLPATVALVAAANPPAVAVDGWELPPPIANRLMHLQWVFDADEWLTGVTTDFAHQVCPPLAAMLGPSDDAAKARVRGAVTAYLRAHRDQINALPRVERRGTGSSEMAAVDPQKASGAWPSPRSWTNAMAAMEQLNDGDDEARYLVVKHGLGCFGRIWCPSAADPFLEALDRYQAGAGQVIPDHGGPLPALGQVVQGDLTGPPAAPVDSDAGAHRRQPDDGEPAVGVRDPCALRHGVLEPRLFEPIPDRRLSVGVARRMPSSPSASRCAVTSKVYRPTPSDTGTVWDSGDPYSPSERCGRSTTPGCSRPASSVTTTRSRSANPPRCDTASRRSRK